MARGASSTAGKTTFDENHIEGSRVSHGNVVNKKNSENGQRAFRDILNT